MAKIFRVYHIICEGDSEVAYVNELNRYIRDTRFELVLKAYNLHGVSSYNGIKKKYRDAKRNKKKTDEVFIWLDNDVFKRGKLSRNELQKHLAGFSGVKYNFENFEDFLVMHLSIKQVRDWHEICVNQEHFEIPMTGENVKKRIKAIFPDYVKGCLPSIIHIEDKSLSRLCENQKIKN